VLRVAWKEAWEQFLWLVALIPIHVLFLIFILLFMCLWFCVSLCDSFLCGVCVCVCVFVYMCVCVMCSCVNMSIGTSRDQKRESDFGAEY